MSAVLLKYDNAVRAINESKRGQGTGSAPTRTLLAPCWAFMVQVRTAADRNTDKWMHIDDAIQFNLINSERQWKCNPSYRDRFTCPRLHHAQFTSTNAPPAHQPSRGGRKWSSGFGGWKSQGKKKKQLDNNVHSFLFIYSRSNKQCFYCPTETKQHCKIFQALISLLINTDDSLVIHRMFRTQ